MKWCTIVQITGMLPDGTVTGSGEPPEDVRRELDGLRARLSGKEA